METKPSKSCELTKEPFVNIVEDGFGFYTDSDGNREIVRRYTFTNQNCLTVQVITYGATITSIKYPDKCGIITDVVLGFDNIEGYMSPNNPYMGAIIGRVTNRIAKGHFKIDGEHYQLSVNNGEHHLHGGFFGFDKKNWKSDVQGTKLVLTYLSKDGEEGYPGEVLVSVSYELTTDNSFLLDMKATTTKPTPVNLTNHTYFNLAGHDAGSKEMLEHLISINCDLLVTTDEDSIPTGCLQPVTGTVWDLRIAQKMGTALPHIPFGGYDHCLCINRTEKEQLSLVARVVHPGTARTLEVYSNQPGVQFYTANKFPRQIIGGVLVNEGGDGENQCKGKNGVYYYKHHAFCLETQNFPDAVNQKKNFRNLDVDAEACPIRVCPICGYVVKDPDFENPLEKCCSDEKVVVNVANEAKLVRLVGKEHAEYYYHGAFCFMPENFPDAVHRKNFPQSILRPGEIYNHVVQFKFGLFEEVILEPEDAELKIDEWPGEGEIEISEKNEDSEETKL